MLVVSAACDRAANGGPAAEPLPPASPPSHDAPSVDALRAAHDFVAEAEGAPCQDDRDCQSPLRCLDAGCLFPPAMSGQVTDDLPRVVFHGDRLADVTYTLELADDAWETTRGLMHRNSMVEDMGMIFVFDGDEPRRFWMRNTFIPLDMVFVRSDGRVDSFVENAAPRTDTGRSSAGPARYVIELNAGEVARMGLQPGSRAEIIGLPPALAPVE